MLPVAKIADSVHSPGHKENYLQPTTAKKITKDVQSPWKVLLLVNFGIKLRYPTPDTQYIYVGDDDTTTLCQMQEKVPYGVEKWSDITHAKRSLTTRLYNISQHNKFTDCSPLTQKVINYLAKCFSYTVLQKTNEIQSS